MRWRWDQGRLQYFRYENIVKLAAVLESLDGVALGNGPDLLRAPLASATELPFLPVRYKVWRNYARVFECALLATRVDGRLAATDLCRKMARRPSLFPPNPDTICNACGINTKMRYPWTDNILELHHVLPLAASLNANGTTTLLDDLVALCPSCHKSIHVFYRIKLREWGIEDFGSKKMALDVYAMAKREIVV